MTTISIPTTLKPPIQAMQVARNGKYPDASVQSRLAELVNQAAAYRTKEVLTFGSPVAAIPYKDGTRTRWRFAYHSGPRARYLLVRAVLARSNVDGDTGTSTDDSYANLLVETASGTDVGNVQFHFGAGLEVTADYPSTWGTVSGFLASAGGVIVTVTADTEYFGTFTDVDNARIVAASVYEVSLAADSANYVSGDFSSQGPIYDEDRGDVAELASDMWIKGAGHLWNWASEVDADAVSNSTTTAKNIFDSSITTVSSATPGVTLDLTNKTTVRRAADGVPVKWWVYGDATTTGTVYLKDSGGTALLSITVGATAGWYSVTGSLPATVAKYDLQMKSGDTNPTKLYASSLYQFEPPPPLACGDGSDGAVVFDGTTTVLGLVPSGGVYTLTGALNHLGPTVFSGGAEIRQNGYPMYVLGSITGTGKITRNGTNGQNGNSDGTGGNAGAGSSDHDMAGLNAGGAGSAGPVSGSAAANNNPTNAGFTAGAAAGGGVGGVNGADGSTGQGGGGGGATTSGGAGGNNTLGGVPTVATSPRGGGSGGGGGAAGLGAGAAPRGGGGGSSAGHIFICADSISGVTIECIGGNGGNGAAGGGGFGESGAGGGGGGSGGTVTLHLGSGASLPTIDVSGGTGGTGGTGASNGGDGGDGGDGVVDVTYG